jgi:hypothetical protein
LIVTRTFEDQRCQLTQKGGNQAYKHVDRGLIEQGDLSVETATQGK